ncbi:MAG TPA: hypothetical protein VGV37_01920 [Aliidongia sp.]|uniref:hypothetical protein n=1 Tax=Aliidongia sp. TaxID=1914230 RepID=UPI002DDCFD6E|nr:hypothetical protein [Aliidongia sp.]HEV2673268.1 hypothetical protein [Aliidongia sp.]
MSEGNQQFDSFIQWVNKASSWLCRRGPQHKAICLDAKNRLCVNGADMMRARDEGAFPVRWLWPEDVAKLAGRPSSVLSQDIAAAVESVRTDHGVVGIRALGDLMSALGSSTLLTFDDGTWLPCDFIAAHCQEMIDDASEA